MADALTALDEMNAQIATLSRAANSGRSKYLSISDAQPVARAIATIYFESIRGELEVVKSRSGLVEEIDFVIQQLLQLATSSREKQAYIGQLNELRLIYLRRILIS
jgi:hypothetical protein